MTKDYAKKRRPQPIRARAKYQANTPYATEQTLMPAWAWMSAGLILGLALATMLYWKLHNQPALGHALSSVQIQEQKPMVSNTKHKTKSKNPTAGEGEAEKNNARFDFYALLPSTGDDPSRELQSSVGDDPLASNLPDVARAPKDIKKLKDINEIKENKDPALASHEPLSTGAYIIQAGSFSQLDSAQALRAQLALLGFESRIQTFKSDRMILRYRVFLGPFETQQSATARRAQLEQAHQLHSLVIKHTA